MIFINLFVTTPQINSGGNRSLPILKWISDLAVWAPKYLSVGTWISPIESDSVRNEFMMRLYQLLE
jgi:hypothetical protein